MLCPRCNSENELGEKFCRHCGAPLTDKELFSKTPDNSLSQRIMEKIIPSTSQKPHSLNSKAYKRNNSSAIVSLVKSLIVLIILLIGFYYLAGFVLGKIAENTNNYSISGKDIPSINYVLGDRSVKKVKYSYDDKKIKVEYIFENIEEPTTDLVKYVSYLMANNKFELQTNFDPTEEGNIKLAAIEAENKYIVDINWTKDSYSLVLYKDKV